MKSKNYLVSSRQATFKFLLRCQWLPDLGLDRPSALNKLSQFLVENEKELLSQSVDVFSLHYAIDLDTVINSSFVGLFWFANDYSKVIDICGVREFTKGDVIAKTNLSPDGGHVDYSDNTHSTPRGRVSLHDGHVIISAGTECPDSALQLVVDAFGLKEYKGSNLRVFKDVHWDTRGISGSGY